MKNSKKLENDVLGARNDGFGDPEMADLGQTVLLETKDRQSVLEDELKLMLVPKDPEDSKDVIFKYDQARR